MWKVLIREFSKKFTIPEYGHVDGGIQKIEGSFRELSFIVDG